MKVSEKLVNPLMTVATFQSKWIIERVIFWLRIMKKFRALVGIFCLIAMTASCQSVAPAEPHWHEDGRIESSSDETIQLDLQNLYGELRYQHKTYLLGFRIDAEGINTPYVAEVSDDLKSIRYWPFTGILNDLFLLDGRVSVNDMSGRVYQLGEKSWETADLSFPNDAYVIYSDNKESLIVCHAASMQMASTRTSGCYSINPDWHHDFTWFDVRPQVCGNALYIYENAPSGGTFKVLSMDSGEILYSRPLSQAPKQICDIDRT